MLTGHENQRLIKGKFNYRILYVTLEPYLKLFLDRSKKYISFFV